MATIAEVHDRGISVGRVFERALAAVRHNLLITIAIAFLFGGLPALAFELLRSMIRPEYLVLTVGATVLPGSIALFLIDWFASHIFGALVQGGIVRAVIADHESRRVTFGESVTAVLRSLPGLVGLGALIGIGVEIGTTLLLVPAIIIFVFWSVAPSVLAEEGEGIFMALSRSQELGEGARWKILATTSVIFVVTSILSICAALVSRPLGVDMRTANLSVGYMLLMAPLGSIVNLFWGAGLASLYVELREWKEGSSVSSLGEIFA